MSDTYHREHGPIIFFHIGDLECPDLHEYRHYEGLMRWLGNRTIELIEERPELSYYNVLLVIKEDSFIHE